MHKGIVIVLVWAVILLGGLLFAACASQAEAQDPVSPTPQPFLSFAVDNPTHPFLAVGDSTIFYGSGTWPYISLWIDGTKVSETTTGSLQYTYTAVETAVGLRDVVLIGGNIAEEYGQGYPMELIVVFDAPQITPTEGPTFEPPPPAPTMPAEWTPVAPPSEAPMVLPTSAPSAVPTAAPVQRYVPANYGWWSVAGKIPLW